MKENEIGANIFNKIDQGNTLDAKIDSFCWLRQD